MQFTRTRYALLTALLGIAALVLAGCGGDDNGLSAEDMARLAAAEEAAMMAQQEAAAAHEEAEAAKEDAAAADMRAMEAEAAAAAAQAEAEKEVEIPEPDTSELEDTIAALEEQIEELEDDADAEADRVALLGMSAADRIQTLLRGSKPMGSTADVAATQAAVMAQLKSPAASVWYRAADIIPDAVIANSGLFYDFNGDGVLNNNADSTFDTADDLLGTTANAAGTTRTAPAAPALERIGTINEFYLGYDVDNTNALEPAVSLATGATPTTVLLDERILGDMNGSDATSRAYGTEILPLSMVVESSIRGTSGNLRGEDLDGDGLIETTAYTLDATATFSGQLDEGVLSTMSGRTDNVGLELRQAMGRYQFQYDDDGDNQPADVRLGANTATALTGGGVATLTPEGIDMRDHLSTFSMTPVVDVHGVKLVKFSIDSAYRSDSNVAATTGTSNIGLPLAPDPTALDDVPTTRDGRYGVESYGAWLSDSFFAIHKFTAVTNIGANTAGTSAGASAATATRATRWVANRSGGSPSTLRGLGESATWTGAMVGHDTTATAEADMLLQGNARIDAHIRTGTLATADAEGVAVMDVMLDNITDQNGMDARVTELSWSDLDIITANGGAGFRKARSSDPRVEAEIEGWVFGDANEIVGQFNKSGIIGAFGATLDPDADMMDMASDQ